MPVGFGYFSVIRSPGSDRKMRPVLRSSVGVYWWCNARVPSQASGDGVLDASAVQFCARKVSAVSGDARKALDICR